MSTAVEDEIIRALVRRAEGDVDAAALRSGALTRARGVRRRRRIVACLAAVAVLAGAVGVVEVLRNGHTAEESADQTGDVPPALPAADVPGALQRPDTVATDPAVIHFGVDAAALNAIELTWRSIWTQEGVSIRTADRGENLIHFTISQEADRVVHGYPGSFHSKFPWFYADPPVPAPDFPVNDPRYPFGDGRQYRPIPVVGAPGTVKVMPNPADSTRGRYLMVWSPVAGLTATLEMVASNPDDVVRTARAFRLDRSQRCAVPGIARNAPGDARFFECETSVRTPDAGGAFWNYSIITFSARGGNYVDVLFGNLTIPQPFEANRTVDGRPARWFEPTPNPEGAKLEVPGEPGRHLIVSVRSWNFTEAEVQRIADSFEFSGDPRDITTWPTNPAP
jgi:hypothetical protein